MPSRHPLLNLKSKTSDIVKAEATIVAHLPSVLGSVKVPINGVMMTAAQIVEQIQDHRDTITTLDSLRAEAKAALAIVRARQEAVKATVRCVRSYVTIAFGEHTAQFASLGFSPHKPAEQSAESKAMAVTKALATRAARHTKGKRQKAAIHGIAASSEHASARQPSDSSGVRRALA
jgi:hypothetical protein